MTDGTSHGLFILVAIVIFGIFVLMAYILFEDTLSPAMASMFTEATENASERLSGITQLDTALFYTGDEFLQNIALDFNRTYTDTNQPFPSFSGLRGDLENGMYTLNLNLDHVGRPTRLDSLGRVYVQHNYTLMDYTIEKATLHINGEMVSDEVELLTNDLGNRRYVLYTPNLNVEKDTPYHFVFRAYTETGDYFEFEKTFIFKD